MVLWLLFFVLIAPKTLKSENEYPYTSPTYIYAYNSILSVTDIRKLEMEDIIRQKAILNNVDPDLLIRVARCESGLNPEAKNPISTASGLFQFLTSTFINQAQARGLDITDKNSPDIQAELAAEIIADGGINNWLQSKSCWSK